MADGFQTTRWSVVLGAGESSPEARRALEWLCESYWYPVYAFVRRQVGDEEAAKDLTQAYFVALLDKQYIRQVDRERGRFRAFLCASVRNFLAKARERERAEKRRADNPRFRISLDGAEERYRDERIAEGDPERQFDRRWAVALLGRALGRLADEHPTADRRRQFERLRPYLTGSDDGAPYARVADDLGMTEGAVRVAVHRLRRRLGHLLREEVAHTIADVSDSDAELRYLLEIMGA